MSRIKCLLIMLWLCAGPPQVYARVTLIETDAGLQDKRITAITRDARGLMWIGTRQGLYSFDGYRFLPLPDPGLRTATVNRLHYSPGTDVLWISSDTGLFMLHCRALRLHPAGSHRDGALTASALVPGGSFYAAYQSGTVYQVDSAGAPHLIARMPASFIQGDYSSRIEPERDGTLLLRTELVDRYFMLDTRSGNITPMPSGKARLNPFFVKRSGRWRVVFGESRLYLQDPAMPLRYPAFTEPHVAVTNIVDVEADPGGELYALGRPSKLYRLRPPGRQADTISAELFTGRTFNCFFIDPQGIIWIGTNKGLLRVSNDTRLFTQLLVQNPQVSVRAIALDDAGRYYAGTYSGLFRSEDDGRRWERISTQIPNRIIDLPGPFLYFAGGDSSLYRIGKWDGEVSTSFWLPGGPSRQAIGEAYALHPQAGLLWIGSSHGLFVYDPARNTLRSWEGNHRLPANTHINFIGAGAAGGLRVCSNAGLYEFDRSGALTAHFSSASRPALSANRLLHAVEDPTGRLWLCTAGGGINILQKDRSSVTVLNQQDGLSNNETYQLLWQGPQVAWISTFNGLSRYDLRSGTFLNYYSADGLSTNEFNHNAFLRDRQGRIWFGSISGINRFVPDSMPELPVPARLFVSSLSKWDNLQRRFRTLPAADTLTPVLLQPGDHSLSFTLGLTDYSFPENNTFMYRLPGVFDEWVRLEGSQALRLDGLAAGRYMLEIRALDGRGRPAGNMLRYRIEVREVFYKTWWFYLLLFIVASLLIWAFFRLRLQNIKRVQQLRQQIASDLHDEVGSLLTRITMTSDNLRYSRNPEEERSAKLEKIAALSRNASSSMSDILWAIDARNDYTGNLSDRMREHAEEMLQPQNTELTFDIQLSQRMSISSQLRQQLYLIFKEAINNIVKHSRAGQVQIRYHHNERGFRLEIRNNGSAAGEKAGARSQGLKNMRMRAARIGAQIEIGECDGWFSVVLLG